MLDYKKFSNSSRGIEVYDLLESFGLHNFTDSRAYPNPEAERNISYDSHIFFPMSDNPLKRFQYFEAFHNSLFFTVDGAGVRTDYLFEFRLNRFLRSLNLSIMLPDNQTVHGTAILEQDLSRVFDDLKEFGEDPAEVFAIMHALASFDAYAPVAEIAPYFTHGFDIPHLAFFLKRKIDINEALGLKDIPMQWLSKIVRKPIYA